MKIRSYHIVLVSAIAITSCGGGNDNDYIDKSLIPPAAEKKAGQMADSAAAPAQGITIQPNNTIPGTIPANPTVNLQPVNATASTVSAQPAAQTTAPGMNPPHGQPGHRCDIAVGAPLNSKPVQAAIQAAPTVSAQPAAQQPTAPGMNPPHGQPGHRCDIAVGAPLNSKPVQATVTPSASAASAAIPAKPDSIKNN